MDIHVYSGKTDTPDYRRYAASGKLFDNPQTLSQKEFARMDTTTAVQFIRDHFADNQESIQDYIGQFINAHKDDSAAIRALLNVKTADGYAFLFIRPESFPKTTFNISIKTEPGPLPFVAFAEKVIAERTLRRQQQWAPIQETSPAAIDRTATTGSKEDILIGLRLSPENKDIANEYFSLIQEQLAKEIADYFPGTNNIDFQDLTFKLEQLKTKIGQKQKNEMDFVAMQTLVGDIVARLETRTLLDEVKVLLVQCQQLETPTEDIQTILQHIDKNPLPAHVKNCDLQQLFLSLSGLKQDILEHLQSALLQNQSADEKYVSGLLKNFQDKTATSESRRIAYLGLLEYQKGLAEKELRGTFKEILTETGRYHKETLQSIAAEYTRFLDMTSTESRQYLNTPAAQDFLDKTALRFEKYQLIEKFNFDRHILAYIKSEAARNSFAAQSEKVVPRHAGNTYTQDLQLFLKNLTSLEEAYADILTESHPQKDTERLYAEALTDDAYRTVKDKYLRLLAEHEPAINDYIQKACRMKDSPWNMVTTDNILQTIGTYGTASLAGNALKAATAGTVAKIFGNKTAQQIALRLVHGTAFFGTMKLLQGPFAPEKTPQENAQTLFSDYVRTLIFFEALHWAQQGATAVAGRLAIPNTPFGQAIQQTTQTAFTYSLLSAYGLSYNAVCQDKLEKQDHRSLQERNARVMIENAFYLGLYHLSAKLTEPLAIKYNNKALETLDKNIIDNFNKIRADFIATNNIRDFRNMLNTLISAKENALLKYAPKELKQLTTQELQDLKVLRQQLFSMESVQDIQKKSHLVDMIKNREFNIAGIPGPGITEEQIRAVQQFANNVQQPVAVWGSRQTGVSYATGKIFNKTYSDLDLAAVGAEGYLKIADGPWKEIPGVQHDPLLFESSLDALARGAIIVHPWPVSAK